MKKRLTEEEFQATIKELVIGDRNIRIAHSVLVDGRSQSDFVAELGVSKGAVSQVVNRVWHASGKELPSGFQRVTAVLPEHQAFIVKRWEEDAKSRSK